MVYNSISENSTVKLDLKLKSKISEMKTDQAKIMGKAAIQFKAHDLEIILRKVRNQVKDLGLYLSRRIVKLLHHKSAIDSFRAGCSGFMRRCGGPSFLAAPIYVIMRNIVLEHMMKGGHPPVDLKEWKS